MATIEYAYKPMAMGAYHISIIYKPDVGQYEYMSFYASGYTGQQGGSSQELSNLVGGASAAANGTTSPLGTIVVESGKYAYAGKEGVTYDPNSSRDYDTKLIASGNDLSAKWSAMKACGQEVASENLAYSALTQNSNSAAYTCTKAAGIEPPAPDGVTDPHWTPAADHILPTSKTQASDGSGSHIQTDENGQQHLLMNDADGNKLDFVQIADGGVQAQITQGSGVNRFETTKAFEADGDLLGSFKTEHQTNTAASNDVLATKLQTLLDQNTSHDSQVLEASEIRAVAGAQGKDEAWGGGRMLDVSDSHLGDYYWTNEHSSATDAPLATDTNTHGLGLVDGFDMGNGAGVYEPDNSGGSNGSNAWADNGGYSGDTTSWSDPGTSGGGYTGGGYVPPDIPYTPYDPGGYDYGGGYDYYAPVVLDMDGDGIELVAKADSRAWFDVKGDGQKHNIGWVGKDDAMLVIDDNKNGLVDQAKELSLALWTADTTDTDLQALKTVFDTNKDGVFNNQDARFADFRVWQDANGDGVTDAGELKTLAQAGIASINLTEAKADLSTGGNHVAGFASYTTTAGAIKVVGDVGLGYDTQGWTASQDTSFVRMTESGGLVYGVAQSATLNLNLGSSNLDGVVGSTGNDTLAAGSKSAVMLQGGAGNDSLTGGAGDDWLQGDAGADTLLGGAGDDTLLIDQADLTSGRVDGGDGFDVAIITDDQATTMNLASKNLEAVVGGAGNDNFSTTATTRVILSGGAGNDTLSGGTAGDILFGGTGNDSLAGGAGSDIYVFNRGDGADTITDSYSVQVTTTEWYNETVYYPAVTYVRKQRTVTTTQEANAGSGDTLRLGSDIALEDIKLTASGADMVVGVLQNGVATTDQITLKNWTNVNARIEYIQTADGKSFAIADILAGTVNNDTLTGSANANMINGGTGADTLRGGAGDDTYVVDNASDIVTENANEGTDTVRASVSYTLGANIENLTLTGTAIINGTGNVLNNIIKGNSANNTLDGGAGADTMSGGAGDDTYIVDSTGDVVTEHLNEGFDTIQSSVTYTLGASLENLILTGAAAINGTGNELSNTLTGNSAANVLTAGAGNDVLIGGGGADTLVGGAGDDVYVVSDAATTITENANEGTDTVRSSVSYALAANVENLTLTGTAAINGTGNALNNTITGNAANNVLSGGFGNDTLIGGAGDDVLDGAVDQTIRFYSLNGTAKVYLGAASDVTTLTISGGVLPSVQAGQSIKYIGASADESVYVTAGSTVDAVNLMASGGNDRVYLTGKFADYSQTVNQNGEYIFTRINGLASGQSEVVKVSSTCDSDVLYFADGHVAMQSDLVQVTGTSLQDEVTYGFRKILQSDLLAGGTVWLANTPILSMGADTLIGGTGNDTYMVDDAGDVVTELVNEGTDTVQSYLSSYTLAANVENLQLMGAQGTGVGNSLANTITGTGGNDKLSGGFGNDTLIGGAGDDVLDGAIDQIIQVSSQTDTGNGRAIAYLGSASDFTTLTINGGVLPSVQAGQSVKYYGGSCDEFIYVTPGSVVDATELGVGNDKVYLSGQFSDYSQAIDQESGVYTLTRTRGLSTGQSEIVKVTISTDDDVLYFADGYIGLNFLTNAHLSDPVTGAFLPLQYSWLTKQNTVLPANTPILSMGADTLIGGTGNDTYVVDDAGDVVTELVNEGTDSVQSYIGNYTLTANVENLQLMGVQNINGTGNGLDNTITGNSGSNVLMGGFGNDTLIGGAGDDVLDGLIATPMFRVFDLSANGDGTVWIDTGLGSDHQTIAIKGGVLPSVQSGQKIQYEGSDADEIVYVTPGSQVDATMLLSGNDKIYLSGCFSDYNQSIDQDTGGYTLTRIRGLPAGQTEVVSVTVSNENDALYFSDGYIGLNAIADSRLYNQSNGQFSPIQYAWLTLANTPWPTDIPILSMGADTLIGGTGNDTYMVDDAGDVVTENLNEGSDTVQSYIGSYTLTANVENLQLMGAQGTGVGNSLANTITGTGGNDKLSGGFGNDTLIGGAGDDVLDSAIDQTIQFFTNTPTGNGDVYARLGNANDGANLTINGGVLPSVQAGQSVKYYGGSCDEFIYVTPGSVVDATELGGGNDKVYLSGQFADYSQTIDQETGVYTLTRIHGLSTGQAEIVKVTISTDDDVLYFSDGYIGLNALADTRLYHPVTGAFSPLQYSWLTKQNTVLPANTPILSMGADTLIGGTGNDTYVVDDAGDVVTELVNEGTDTVQSYIGNYTLTANVENLQLMGVQNINGTGNGLANTITGNSGSNVLMGGAGADTFVFKTNMGSNNADTITDFSRADGDVIALSSAIFAKLMGKTNLTNNYRLSNQAAVGGDDYIVYNASTGQLAYDASGNGTTTATVFATLANKPQDLTAAQFVVI